jgi:hypothetical protein
VQTPLAASPDPKVPTNARRCREAVDGVHGRIRVARPLGLGPRADKNSEWKSRRYTWRKTPTSPLQPASPRPDGPRRVCRRCHAAELVLPFRSFRNSRRDTRMRHSMGERHHTLVSVCGGTHGDGMLDATQQFPIVARPFVLKSIAIVVGDARLLTSAPRSYATAHAAAPTDPKVSTTPSSNRFAVTLDSICALQRIEPPPRGDRHD